MVFRRICLVHCRENLNSLFTRGSFVFFILFSLNVLSNFEFFFNSPLLLFGECKILAPVLVSKI